MFKYINVYSCLNGGILFLLKFINAAGKKVLIKGFQDESKLL